MPRGNHRYVFMLIHKFQTPELLCDRPDVIVPTDEAHRSQYDTLALKTWAGPRRKSDPEWAFRKSHESVNLSS